MLQEKRVSPPLSFLSQADENEKMKLAGPRWIHGFFEAAFLWFMVSFFLTVGADHASLIRVRMIYGGILLAVSLILPFKGKDLHPLRSLSVLCFLAFLGFEMARMMGALWQILQTEPAPETLIPLSLYLSAPLKWSLGFGFFLLSALMWGSRDRTRRLLWVLSGCGFFLAFNLIPALLIRGKIGYEVGGGQSVFFHPLFYCHETAAKYLLGRSTHPNYIGDLIGLGFFPALGLFFYALHLWREKQKKGGLPKGLQVSAASLGLPALCLATAALAVILAFSRGSIMCFTGTFVLYLLAVMLKFPSRRQLAFSGAAFLLITGFLLWSADLTKTWTELQTLQSELDTSKETSFSTNREGARRALAIYRAYPIWGVGTNGYTSVSEKFAAPGSERWLMAKFKAMCHYLQLLAEEGIGAYFYFLFLAAYVLEALGGLGRAKSRFQFLAGLSLFLPVVMILSHASFSHLLERFSISMLLYLFMGASLGVLRKDFEQA